MFPAVDPIPLPAPVWLFKVLSLVTLALHFIAMHLLVGGLALATAWSIAGRGGKNKVLLDAAGTITSRLPVVMTYVINLGVPPLLFAQVLYGRALYTSTVVMGAWWLSVIFLLMISYSCLYAMTHFAGKGRAYGWLGLIALLVVMKIGAIYVGNMTLMLRPDAWLEMYRTNPHGTDLPTGDATMLPRWVFMMVGSFAVTGLGLMWLGQKRLISEEAAQFLRRWGGIATVVGVAAQVACGFWVMKSQPEVVSEGLAASRVCSIATWAWLGTAALMALLGVGSVVTSAARNMLIPAGAALVGLLNVIAAVVVRDAIRDVTLAGSGFDVWNRTVVTNWSVVGLFLLLFVAGLGVVGWLVLVVKNAEGVKESYA